MKFEIRCDVGQATASTAGTAIFTLPPGYRYKSLTRQLTAAATAIAVNYPGDSRLKINGNTCRVLTPTQLNRINALNNEPGLVFGTTTTARYSIYYPSATEALLTEYLHEPWGVYDPSERYALDVLAEDLVTVEVDYAAIVAAPTVKLIADAEPLGIVAADRSRGVYNRHDGAPTLVKYSRGQDIAAGATMSITKWNKTLTTAEAIHAIHLADPTGGQTIDECEVQVNKRTWFKRTKNQNAKELRDYGMNPAVGFFDIVPNASGAPRDGWIIGPNDDVEINLVLSAAAITAVSWITQSFGRAA